MRVRGGLAGTCSAFLFRGSLPRWRLSTRLVYWVWGWGALDRIEGLERTMGRMKLPGAAFLLTCFGAATVLNLPW